MLKTILIQTLCIFAVFLFTLQKFCFPGHPTVFFEKMARNKYNGHIWSFYHPHKIFLFHLSDLSENLGPNGRVVSPRVRTKKVTCGWNWDITTRLLIHDAILNHKYYSEYAKISHVLIYLYGRFTRLNLLESFFGFTRFTKSLDPHIASSTIIGYCMLEIPIHTVGLRILCHTGLDPETQIKFWDMRSTTRSPVPVDMSKLY